MVKVPFILLQGYVLKVCLNHRTSCLPRGFTNKKKIPRSLKENPAFGQSLRLRQFVSFEMAGDHFELSTLGLQQGSDAVRGLD